MANSNQQRLKVIEDDDENHHNHEQVLCHDHDFWNEAPDDLLTEIFVRLLDSRLAAQASTVCLRWHSLIRQNPSQFIEQFKSHHPVLESSLPWAILFCPYSCSEANNCHVCSDEWLFLHGKLPDNCFDFLPNSSSMHIKGSCNDLFLVSPTPRPAHVDDLCVCNPITKQFVHILTSPRLDDDTTYIYDEQHGVIAYALLRTSDNVVRFKVVQVLIFYIHISSQEPQRFLRVAEFCSMSREWETRSIPFPGVRSDWNDSYHFTNNIVTVDGVLYWMDRRNIGDTLVYLDLSKDKCGTILLPWSWGRDCKHGIGAVSVSGGSHELRLLQIDVYWKKIVHLKVWRLHNNNNSNNRDDESVDDSNLIIVHDKRTLARPENFSETSCSFRGAFVHPTNGDLLLCVWGKNVFEYNLVDSTYKKIAELSSTCPLKSRRFLWSVLLTRPPALIYSNPFV